MKSLARQWAVVTGASSGIGRAFATQLAGEGFSVVLIARRTHLLEALALELRARFKADVDVMTADLSTIEGRAVAVGAIHEHQPLGFLVNAAGFGIPGHFIDSALPELRQMVDVHVVAALELCHAAGRLMRDRGSGSIINVASIGALIARPGDAVYCGTKAFLTAFSSALAGELRPHGVHVLALCPGFTRTGFFESPKYMDVPRRLPRWAWMDPDEVVFRSLRALRSGHVVFVPGLGNRLLVTLSRLGLGSLLVHWLDRELTS